jgi:RNA polymerase sigma-70 factor (ECF subfamily)
LRHATIDGLTLDQIAATYQVHRATVARTLASARQKLLETTRAGVIANLGIVSAELDSAIKLLDSQIDLSLSRVLGEHTPQ